MVLAADCVVVVVLCVSVGCFVFHCMRVRLLCVAMCGFVTYCVVVLRCGDWAIRSLL